MEKRIAAIAMHPHNQAGMTATFSIFLNMTFENVGRKVYFGSADPDDKTLSTYGTRTSEYYRLEREKSLPEMTLFFEGSKLLYKI